MQYYELLNLKKEPFSTSPDPSFLYKSPYHNLALNRLEIAIRLRRGLSILLGDVGTGKTTLSRTLINNFKNEDNFIFHLILDPGYKTEFQFLDTLCRIFNIETKHRSTNGYKEALERYLFQKGVEEGKVVVLLIDEGQTLRPLIIETLRLLLNYETNEFKLLQLVITAQMEFLQKISAINNFFDRIAFKYILKPLSESETKEMINFRLTQAGYSRSYELFTNEAISLIHNYTKGYPRKVMSICHNALESLIVTECKTVDGNLIHKLISDDQIWPTVAQASNKDELIVISTNN